MPQPAPTGEYEFRPVPVADVVYAFEKAFRAGTAPVLDDFLQGGGADRWHLLVELIHSELELRIRAGQPTGLSDYTARSVRQRSITLLHGGKPGALRSRGTRNCFRCVSD